MLSRKRKQQQQRKSDKYTLQNTKNPRPSRLAKGNFNNNTEQLNRVFEFSTISLKKVKDLSIGEVKSIDCNS